jgi:hypothetical protein
MGTSRSSGWPRDEVHSVGESGIDASVARRVDRVRHRSDSGDAVGVDALAILGGGLLALGSLSVNLTEQVYYCPHCRKRVKMGADLCHHCGQPAQGEFNRSSQRSIERSCDGREETGGGSGWAAGDALSGASAGG